ncbi:MAG: dihydropteroate synthase [Deltaproteobacteria bacterium]|nr:dihydropteroate synthase [Deltaproteobacteria bacterium]
MILAADNLTAANPIVAEAMARLDPKPLQDLARRCEAAGAHLLDLNPGYLPKRRQDRMAFMVDAVQAASSLPLILDSPDAVVLARGLAACRTKPILSALTLEEHKLAEILPLAAAHDTDLVILLLDERSFPPPTAEGKIALAVEIRERALAEGLKDEQLIFDPVVPNLSWPDAWRQTGEVVKTVRWLAGGQVFGEPARTMAGISNLRSGLRRQYPIEFDVLLMAMLAGAGLEVALADALRPEITEAVRFIRQMH